MSGKLVGALQSCFSPNTELTQLETLVLDLTTGHATRSFSGVSFPRINKLRLNGYPRLSIIPFSVAQLHKLHLEDAGYLYYFLPKLQSIQWLIIDIFYVPDAAWAEDQAFSVTLPSLKILELSTWVAIVGQVVAPNLETLSLGRLDEIDLKRCGRYGILKFLQNSGANVAELSFSNVTLDASGMSVQLFSTLPAVELLSIICEDGEYEWHPSFVIGKDGEEAYEDFEEPATSSDWDALTQEYLLRVVGFAKVLTRTMLVKKAKNGAYLIFPRLRHLSLDIRCQNHHFGKEDKAGIIDMLEDRISEAGDVTLQSVSLRFQEDDPWNVELIERLGSLARRGLRIEGSLLD